MKAFEEALSKRMDRREFIAYMGVLVVTVIGIPEILNRVGNIFAGKPPASDKTTSFGIGTYGGIKKGGN